MDFEKLFRLFSIYEDDLKWYESWDMHWDWLSAEGYIHYRPPYLTVKGHMTVQYAVKKAGEI